jgi:predicted RNA binding protein YcfA (HicA-like mRNA interferase family)
MKLPRDLSGTELINALCLDWGYQVVHQVGIHIILQTAEPSVLRIAIPSHTCLRIGTLNGILRAVAKHKDVLREDLLASL